MFFSPATNKVYASRTRGDAKMENEKKASARQEFYNFLKARKNQCLSLGSLYPYFRLLTAALYEEKRWKQKCEVNLALGLPLGESMTESVLEHTGIDTPMILAIMLAEELANNTAEDLDAGLLHLAATIHDVGEALKGDVCFSEKSKNDEQEESDFFDLIISVLSPNAAAYFKKAYAIAEERCEVIRRHSAPLASLSRNGRFFWAVEITGYLIKALHETRKGNRAFTEVFYGHIADIIALRTEFYSVRVLFNEEMLREIGRGIWNNPPYK